jgi:hypothetical protein
MTTEPLPTMAGIGELLANDRNGGIGLILTLGQERKFTLRYPTVSCSAEGEAGLEIAHDRYATKTGR